MHQSSVKFSRSAHEDQPEAQLLIKRTRLENLDMKIGILGTGNMGRALGLQWARNGHQVLFGSRDRSKAEAVAAYGHGHAQAADLDAAAAFGEVILYTVRDILPST